MRMNQFSEPKPYTDVGLLLVLPTAVPTDSPLTCTPGLAEHACVFNVEREKNMPKPFSNSHHLSGERREAPIHIQDSQLVPLNLASLANFPLMCVYGGLYSPQLLSLCANTQITVWTWSKHIVTTLCIALVFYFYVCLFVYGYA